MVRKDHQAGRHIPHETERSQPRENPRHAGHSVQQFLDALLLVIPMAMVEARHRFTGFRKLLHQQVRVRSLCQRRELHLLPGLRYTLYQQVPHQARQEALPAVRQYTGSMETIRQVIITRKGGSTPPFFTTA